MSAPRRRTYVTIQMLRGLAASAVVLFHLLPFESKYLGGITLMPGGLIAGQAGVDVFFVISGFIVTTVSATQGPHLRDSTGFLVRRFWRVYPTYWVYFVALTAVYLTAPGMINHHATQPPSLLDSFLLLPSNAPPLLLVAWTLSFELYFYLLFAVLLWAVPRPRLPLALAAWGALIVAVRLLAPATRFDPWANLVFNPLNLEFLAGCAIALWIPRERRALGLGLIAASVLGGTLLLMSIGSATPFDNVWLRVGVFGSAAALLVAGCAAWEIPGVTRVPQALRRLGDASYSLYLSHLLTIGVIGLAWREVIVRTRLAGHSGIALHVFALASAFAASVVVGWLSFRLIEAPLVGVMKSWRGAGTRSDTSLKPAGITAGLFRS